MNTQRGFIPVVMLLIGVLAAGAGTVAASQQSVPGDALYGVKNATEKVQLALAAKGQDKAKVQLNITDEKVKEIKKLQEKNANAAVLEKAVSKFEAQQEKALAVTEDLVSEGKGEDVVKKLEDNFIRNQKVIESVLEKAPEAAKPGLERALTNSAQGLERAKAAQANKKK
jgi:hypothetical protein